MKIILKQNVGTVYISFHFVEKLINENFLKREYWHTLLINIFHWREKMNLTQCSFSEFIKLSLPKQLIAWKIGSFRKCLNFTINNTRRITHLIHTEQSLKCDNQSFRILVEYCRSEISIWKWHFLNTKKKKKWKSMTTADGVKNNSEHWSKRWTKTSKSDIFWNVFRMICYICYEKCIKYNMKRRTLHFYKLLTIEYHGILILFCCLWSITFMRFNLFSRTMFKIFEIKIHLLIILKHK